MRLPAVLSMFDGLGPDRHSLPFLIFDPRDSSVRSRLLDQRLYLDLPGNGSPEGRRMELHDYRTQRGTDPVMMVSLLPMTVSEPFIPRS